MMGVSMILPMNVYFRDSRNYHEMVFLLQFGAFVATNECILGVSRACSV